MQEPIPSQVLQIFYAIMVVSLGYLIAVVMLGLGWNDRLHRWCTAAGRLSFRHVSAKQKRKLFREAYKSRCVTLPKARLCVDSEKLLGMELKKLEPGRMSPDSDYGLGCNVPIPAHNNSGYY